VVFLEPRLSLEPLQSLLARPTAVSSLLFGSLTGSGSIKQRKNGRIRMVLKGIDDIDSLANRSHHLAGAFAPTHSGRASDLMFW